MSWLKLPGDTETPELEKITRPYRENGAVPSIVASMKPSPKALRAVLRMNYAVTFGGSDGTGRALVNVYTPVPKSAKTKKVTISQFLFFTRAPPERRSPGIRRKNVHHPFRIIGLFSSRVSPTSETRTNRSPIPAKVVGFHFIALFLPRLR